MNQKPTFASAMPGIPSGTGMPGGGATPTTALADFLHLDGTGNPAGQPAPYAALSGLPARIPSTAALKKPPGRMTPAEAATYLGVQEATLATWRSTRRYNLEYIRIGRKIFYTQAALDRFIASRTVTADE